MKRAINALPGVKAHYWEIQMLGVRMRRSQEEEEEEEEGGGGEGGGGGVGKDQASTDPRIMVCCYHTNINTEMQPCYNTATQHASHRTT